MWTQRDQFSNSQIPVVDRDLIMTQHKTRVMNHPYSELSNAPLSKRGTDTALTVGDLVYLHTDRNKSCARHRYLVASVDGNWCNVRKFVGAQIRSSSYRVKSSECYKVAVVPLICLETPPELLMKFYPVTRKKSCSLHRDRPQQFLTSLLRFRRPLCQTALRSTTLSN